MHNSLPLVAAAAAAAGGCRHRSVLGNGCIRKQHYEAHGVGAAGLAQPPHGVPQERGDAVQVGGFASLTACRWWQRQRRRQQRQRVAVGIVPCWEMVVSGNSTTRRMVWGRRDWHSRHMGYRRSEGTRCRWMGTATTSKSSIKEALVVQMTKAGTDLMY